MAKPKTFTCTIYCGNCRNRGEYEFKRGTILHPVKRSTWAEHRNSVPGGDDAHEIRLDEMDGRRVECKFCRCTTAVHLRERNGDNPGIALTSSPSTPTVDDDAVGAEARGELRA